MVLVVGELIVEELVDDGGDIVSIPILCLHPHFVSPLEYFFSYFKGCDSLNLQFTKCANPE